jgi:hypothetical protein
MECGGKRSATPLSRAEKLSFSSEHPPSESGVAAPLCHRSPRCSRVFDDSHTTRSNLTSAAKRHWKFSQTQRVWYPHQMKIVLKGRRRYSRNQAGTFPSSFQDVFTFHPSPGTAVPG